MKQEQHKKEVKKLTEIEVELIDLIHNLQDDALIDKFSEWQDQRAVCNEGFYSWIDELKKNT